MKLPLHVVHLEDDEPQAELVRLRLVAAFGPSCEVRQARSEAEFTAAMESGGFDLVLSDSAVPGFEGLSALELVRRKGYQVPFIFVCGRPRSGYADHLLAAGAADYIEKGALEDLPRAIERALVVPVPGDGPLTRSVELLISVVEKLSLARNLETVQEIVRHAARELTGADGATFVLRDGEQCFYADEDAISPLWKGCRFPLSACISGWTMQHREAVTIEDIYADARIPHDAYRPTFVKSLAMVPIRVASPIGAIGNYWAQSHRATAEEVRLLQALASSTSIALENVQLYASLDQRVRERTAELEEANRDLEAFSYSVSHDLRSPLAGIMAFADFVLTFDDRGLTDTGRQYLDRILSETGRMSRIIDDLLTLARIGRDPLRRGMVDLAKIAREIADRLQATTPGRQVEWVFPSQLIVDGDPGLLRVAMDNLLGNAWKYSSKRAHATITLGTTTHEGAPAIFVRDNGAGFDPEKADQLFTVFQRLHSPGDFPGTGIGLVTVQRIMHKHGGRIWADAVVDRGATFTFTLG